LLLALAGKGLIVWAFLHALLHPAASISFIYGTMFAIIILEFVSIVVIGLSHGLVRNRIVGWLFLLGMLSPFIGITLFLARSGAGVVYLVVLVLAHIFYSQAAPKDQALQTFGCGTLLVLACAFFVLLTGFIWTSVWPFPQVVYASKPGHMSGDWVAHPQIGLMFGIVYFGLTIISDVHRVWLAQRREPATAQLAPPVPRSRRRRTA
jgi:hypothetical protein